MCAGLLVEAVMVVHGGRAALVEGGTPARAWVARFRQACGGSPWGCRQAFGGLVSRDSRRALSRSAVSGV
ncbi:hypothetical protein, partial [Nonomuraea ferruginea]|uniref:hypothetical protein n=1 Tax=Nonomuraea ferruginea TaxID=46174 RepID=UPI0031EB0129